MNLRINGEQQAVTARTLAQLLKELEFEGGWLATAVNGEIVHRDDREQYFLKENDHVELLTPMQGG